MAGASSTVRVISLVGRYLEVGGSNVAGYLRLGVSIITGRLRVGVSMMVEAARSGLQHIWSRLSTAFGYVRLAVTIALRPMFLGISQAHSYMKVGLSTVFRSVGLALGYVGRGFDAVLRYLGSRGSMAVGYVGVGVSTIKVHLWRGASTVMGYIRSGVLAIRRAARNVLGYLRLGMSAIVRPLWLGFLDLIRLAKLGVSALFRFLQRGIATLTKATGAGLHPLWLGAASMVRILWLGFSSIVKSAGMGLLMVAKAITVLLGYVWLGVSTVLGYLEQGISTLAKATGIALLPVWLGASTIVGYLWLSVSTTVLIFRWTMGAAGQGVSMAIRGLKRAGFLAIRTVRTAYGVVPDLGRITILLIKEGKGVPTMSDFNLTSQRLLSLVVTVLVIFAVSSVLVRVLWPAPPEPRVEVVHWATGHLMRDGLLPDMATQFNKAGHRTKSGKKIVLDVHNVPSELQAEFLTPRVENGTRIDLHNITDGYVDRRTSDTDPTIVTPSSAHWLVSVNHEVGRDVVDLSAAQSIVRPVIGIVTYEEMARCLGWPEKEIGYADILALRADPTTSSTGRSLHLALYSFAAAKPPEELGLEDVNDPSVVAYVKRFQSMIDHYLIGTTVLNTKIHQGPRYGHFFIMPEDNLIHLYEGTERAFVNGKKVTPPLPSPTAW